MGAELDVAVVGAGPYGLSIAAHLQGLNIRHKILGEPMETWRDRMPRGMTLKSDPFASNLFDPQARFTLEAFCRERGISYAPTGWRVPLEMFVDYGLWFRERACPNLDRRKVQRVEGAGPKFSLVLTDGEQLTARRVVVCAGISCFAKMPAQLQSLSPSLVSHSSEHAEPGAYKGRDVTVLGAGASALELAMLMHEAGANVRVVARAPVAKFGSGGAERRSLGSQLRRPTSGLGAGWSNYILTTFPGPFRFFPDRLRTYVVGRALGPAAGWGVRERVEGKVPLLLGHRVVRVAERGAGLQLDLLGPEGSLSIQTDHLVAATGYRADVDKLTFLQPGLRSRLSLVEASPRLTGGFESSVPGLFFAGLTAANTFGPLQRFAFGARFAARRLSAECRK